MAKYIDTSKVHIPKGFFNDLNVPKLLDWLNSQPTADVVPVVRCKDCKHSFFIKSCSKYECQKGCGALKYSNDYCSYGERESKNESNTLNE